MTEHVLVLGGGLAGIATALKLKVVTSPPSLGL